MKPSPPSTDSSYSLADVEQLLGLSRRVLRGLIAAGFVAPRRGRRNEHRFSFQDLLLLRTAHGLRRARVPPRKILQALAGLQPATPLSRLRLSALGRNVVVRDELGARDADSGQFLLDFGATPGASVSSIGAAPDPAYEARRWFAQGESAEAAAGAAGDAEAAYRRAIALAPDFVPPYLNLGALLCEAGRCNEASELYADALTHGAADPLLHFNHAIALEDLGRFDDALRSYAHAVTLDPNFADAHFNAGRLLERLGDAQGALRHLSTYRRLQHADRP